MKSIKFIGLILVLLLLSINLHAYSIQIKVKIQNEIITNIDINKEKKYLLFLNPKLKELKNKKINQIAKNSLITEIIKKKELEKVYDFEKSNNFVNAIEKKFLKSKNIKTKDEFNQILKNRNLDYHTVREKLQIEALWNQLIYNKYINNIKIDRENLRNKILNQYKNKKTKYEYNLSEIFFDQNINEELSVTHNKLKKSIDEIGFENTANLFSISSTSKSGGLIGWINELQISDKIRRNIINLSIDEISEPIKIQGGFLIIKLNKKREFKEEINIENQLAGLVNKETNRQLNTFSIIFYKRLKKNIQINEF